MNEKRGLINTFLFPTRNAHSVRIPFPSVFNTWGTPLLSLSEGTALQLHDASYSSATVSDSPAKPIVNSNSKTSFHNLCLWISSSSCIQSMKELSIHPSTCVVLPSLHSFIEPNYTQNGPSKNLNQAHSCCEATLLTNRSSCRPSFISCLYFKKIRHEK